MDKTAGTRTAPDPFGSHDDRLIRVLHVDDDSHMVTLVSTFLTRESDSLDVHSVTSAEEGLALLREHPFDCIVSDYQMPEMDGLELLSEVRESSPDLPFILFTGKGSEEIASDAITAGVSDYLQKRGGKDQYALLANRIENLAKQYRSQQALVEREERYRRLTETAPFAIVTVDDEGLVQFTNPAVAEIFGYTEAELIGGPLLRLVDERSATAFEDALDRLLTGGSTGGAETETVSWEGIAVTGRHADGRVVESTVGCFAFEHDGTVQVTFVISDVTDEVRREHEFRAVFERAFDAMVIANDEGEFVEVNPAACELFGLPESELLGRSIRGFASPEFDFEAEWASFQAADHDRGRFDLVRPDGQRRIVDYAATREIVPGRHLSILRDVTDQRTDA
ncbi:PAS domain S-box protein [Haloarchaeobius sp. TZWWS8]|uniref:PAS domain S-box protein n=1 Tax=Haloarchaeobius sp. TZWWS8 TaxID=3446121 RepID=UPI003EBB817D